MITCADISTAAARIAPHIRRTELAIAEPLSQRVGATIAVKAEHRQRTGSFKLRGALNKILGLDVGERAAGIVTASSGNHGIAVATAARSAELPCTVYLPSSVSSVKRQVIERLGAAIVIVDSADAYQAEVQARAAAVDGRGIYVSPYNDLQVVAGQGTIGLEIEADAPAAGLDSIDAVVVAVGGGGLISGVATWLAELSPATVVVGASPANDQAMLASVAAGSIVDMEATATFSDGTAGGIEPDAITYDLCRSLVDEWLPISEEEIAEAVTAMVDDHHELVEGAAGVALAASARWGASHPGASIVVVSCGGNVSSSTLRRMLIEAARSDRTTGSDLRDTDR